MKLPYPAQYMHGTHILSSNEGEHPGMEEMEEMTTLSLRVGTPGEHYKSSRGTRCKPVRLHGFFPDHQQQLQAETDHEGHENRDGQARKKLRLTREQIRILENVYWGQTNLDLARKQELAKNLDIEPRQVEVWFQNRRARSKQKKTAVDYENLKGSAELLIEENRKLKRKLVALMAVSKPEMEALARTNSGSSLVVMCSSCYTAKSQETVHL